MGWMTGPYLRCEARLVGPTFLRSCGLVSLSRFHGTLSLADHITPEDIVPVKYEGTDRRQMRLFDKICMCIGPVWLSFSPAQPETTLWQEKEAGEIRGIH